MKPAVCQRLRSLCLTVLCAAGIALFALRLNVHFPEQKEARELLTAALLAEEGMEQRAWPAEVQARRTLFHVFAAGCARFFGEGNGPYPGRCYRVAPVLVGGLALLALFALGSRQSQGVFETPDGGLWAVAFALMILGLIWHGVSFSPYLFEACTVLGLLLMARAYARWPGAASAAGFGILTAVLLSLDANTWWLLPAFIPAVAIGAGWRRLCLYWRLWHVLLALAAALGVGSILMQCGLTGWPTWPSFEAFGFGEDPWPEALWRFLWLCGGGFGLVGWSVLAVWCWRRGDRRWARFFVVLFPPVVIGALCFGARSIFGVAMGVLAALIVGMALSAIPSRLWRLLLGSTTLLALGYGLGWQPDGHVQTWLSREEQRENIQVLRQAFKAPRRHGLRTRIVGGSREGCAQLLWLLRRQPGGAVWAQEAPDDADIFIVSEADLSRLTPMRQRLILPGVVRTGGEVRFRVFAERPDCAEEGL